MPCTSQQQQSVEETNTNVISRHHENKLPFHQQKPFLCLCFLRSSVPSQCLISLMISPWQAGCNTIFSARVAYGIYCTLAFTVSFRLDNLPGQLEIQSSAWNPKWLPLISAIDEQFSSLHRFSQCVNLCVFLWDSREKFMMMFEYLAYLCYHLLTIFHVFD